MATWTTAQYGDIDEITDGRVPWRPVRFHFGIESFGLNVFTGKEAGDRIINEHEEDEGHEEIYFVHSGRARFELDGETVDAAPGAFVYAKPEVRRTAFAEEPNTVLVAMGGTPGKAYESHGWEIWAPLQPLYQAGEYAQVADRLDSELTVDAPWPMLHYNAACIYSLADRKEHALKHLGRAMQLAPDNVRGYAENDDDLANIREEPAFKELFGEPAKQA
ncbi:MAG TPA: cupin domain-containing protein [Gaiellaceae bacterium]|nr:cupin domain-containing protein [Gaiellaceae bacterium]